MNAIRNKKHMQYPLYLPAFGKPERNGKTVLAADVGGTKTNLGLFEIKNDALSLLGETTVSSKSETTFEDIVIKFLENQNTTPAVLSIGVAGPVLNNGVELTNLDWVLHGASLQDRLGIEHAVLINDLEATAYGLAGLAREDVAVIFEPEGKTSPGNMAILAPGTGLGEAGLFWDGDYYRPFATEGGHSDFAGQTDFDLELHTHLREEVKVPSWEHLISGPGIDRIYRFLRDVKGHNEPAWLTENFKNNNDPASVISHAAMRELDATCVRAMELFVIYMAREASSLVMKHKATGGLLLGGGIPPRIYPLLRTSTFREHFIRNSEMTDLLANIPIKVILNSKAALIGAGYYGAFGQHLSLS